MEKKKLNLEISEIGPMAEKLNLAAGLPGPCGPCGQGTFDGPGPGETYGGGLGGANAPANPTGSYGPSNTTWALAHAYYATQIKADSIWDFFGSFNDACGRCHPRGRRSRQNSAGADR